MRIKALEDTADVFASSDPFSQTTIKKLKEVYTEVFLTMMRLRKMQE